MYLKEFDDFKPKDFLKLSQKLNKIQKELNENNSAINRTIMSRIYYSTFLYARQWSKVHLNYNSNPRRDHTQLPNFIAKRGPFSKSWNQNIASSLRELKKLRQQADYDLKIPKKGTPQYKKWNFGDIEYAFKLANEIFDSFENIK